MTYTTLGIVLAKYPPGQSLVGSGEYEVTSLQVTSYYIPQAQSIVDAKLSDRYEVPLAGDVDSGTLTPLITMIATDLVICDMVRDRLPRVPEFIEARCERANAMLDQIREGTMDVQSATPVGLTTDGDFEVWSSTQDYHTIFSPVLDPLEQAKDNDRCIADRDVRLGDTGRRNDGC